MIYLTAFGYNTGYPTGIFRGVDSNGNLCGDSKDPIYVNYPYLYITKPLDSLPLTRQCVNQCPYYDGSAIVPASGVACVSGCTWGVTYDTQGNVKTGTAGNTVITGYDSYLILDRVCIPNFNMFSTVFSSATSAMSGVLQQGDLANFISDIAFVLFILFRIGNISWLL